jgi:hypothetical protein
MLTRAALAGDIPLRANISEEFQTGVVKTSGAPLVSLTVGPVLGVADPRAIRVPLVNASKPTAVCFSAQSLDGRYSGSTKMTEPANATGYGVIQPNPPWRYLSQLAAIPRQEFATLAIYGDSCDGLDTSNPYLPLSYDGPQTELTAAFDAPGIIGRPRAKLLTGDVAIAGICDVVPSSRRAMAFNVKCRFPLQGLATRSPKAVVAIQFERVDRTGSERDEFPILLPP